MQSAHFIVALLDDLVVGTGMLDGDEVKAVFVDPTRARAYSPKTKCPICGAS